MRHRGDSTLRRDLTGGSGDAADTRPLNSAAAKRRVCPSIPPAGIGGMRTLTLPDRRSAGAVRGEAACRRPPRLSSLGPRKPQSGEGHKLIDFLCGIRFPGRRLARPLAAPNERKLLKICKKRVRKVVKTSTSTNFSHSQ